MAAASSVEKNTWFHGKARHQRYDACAHATQISRNAAEYNLRNGIDGSFLVRESESNPGENSISLRFEGKVYHYRVSKANGNFFISKDSAFPSMNELIEHHAKKADGLIYQLKHVVPKKEATVVGFSQDIDDKWEIDRGEITLGAKLGAGQYGEVYEGFWKKYNCKVGCPPSELRSHRGRLPSRRSRRRPASPRTSSRRPMS